MVFSPIHMPAIWRLSQRTDLRFVEEYYRSNRFKRSIVCPPGGSTSADEVQFVHLKNVQDLSFLKHFKCRVFYSEKLSNTREWFKLDNTTSALVIIAEKRPMTQVSSLGFSAKNHLSIGYYPQNIFLQFKWNYWLVTPSQCLEWIPTVHVQFQLKL